MRMNEDGEPINMENMPRPHRRRREKKLMPIDEVNEKFPMMKYKTWVASRAQEGLPTRGGVSTPPSRANSIRDADGAVPEMASKERMSTEDRPTTSATSPVPSPVTAKPVNKEETVNNSKEPENKKQAMRHVSKESTSSTVAIEPRTSSDVARGFYEPSNTVQQEHYAPSPAPGPQEGSEERRESHDDEEDDDEHINAALPPECMGTSGDTCAICIDTLEDDDDVRGLTCGHAFHAVCLDPWLTTRRACCPLCKADYYTPKPRAAAVDGEGATVIAVNLPGDPRSNRMNMPSQPRRTFFGLLRSDRGRRTQNVVVTRRETQPRSSRPRPNNNSSGLFGRRSERSNSTPNSPPSEQASTGGIFSGIRNAIPGFRRGQNTAAQPETQTVTPSQLEAGARGQSA